MIEGQFPAYGKVIPQDNPVRVAFAGAQMADAIRRVSLLANERSRAVKFSFADGEATILSSNPELGEAREVVPVDLQGEALSISFNAQYVLDFLSVAVAERVEFLLKDDSSQGMMVPAEDVDGLEYRYVIMPMRI